MKPVAVAAMGVEPGEETELQQAVVEDATGRRWLVRSPLTAVTGARLRRNDELVRQLSRHVPFKVPAPVGYAAVGQEGHAAVYQHVEGSTLDFAQLPAGAGLSHAVGRALAAIHNIPPAVFEQQDVPSFDAAGCRQRLISEVDRAAESGRVPTRLLARWEEAFDAAPLWQFASTPVHGAFRGGTVVVAFADESAESGRVVAVTDWDEAIVGDPAADMADLYTRASPGAWEAVLDSYALARAQRPDPYLHARARLLAETWRLRGLAHHVAAGDEEATRRLVEALRRMDRLTEDEDSLVPATARAAGAAGAAGVAAVVPAGAAAVSDDPFEDDRELVEDPADDASEWPGPPVEDLEDDDVEHEDVDDAGGVHALGDVEHGAPGTAVDGPVEDDEPDDDPDEPLDDPDLESPRRDPFLDDGDPDPHPDDPDDLADPAIQPDDDITTEVPVPTFGPGQGSGDDPSAGEADKDPTARAVEDSAAPEEGPEVEDPAPDVDGPAGDASQEEEVEDEAPGDGAPEAVDEDAPDEDLLDDDTRLHELYGMPAEEDPRT
ncbi:Macrolide 2'-phosphotransferase [Serinicoccus hydrothermalis]|uniref:Macrolide 2'-phosphotransferase n=2 Tax=Serinicoccus hydrothermalis TaxID=1758689 RepID=A0A1B1NG52_9MICO|nr:Macrolide 2'-phosphotransferase [Serinicoccus hydrothermalis]